MKELKIDNLTVKIFDTREEMGREDSRLAAEKIKKLLSEKETVNILFAAAPSQNELLDNLCEEPGIDWERINAFHMDEYIGLPADAPQSFGNYLKNRIFSKKPFRKIFYINGISDDPKVTCQKYTELLKEYPLDMGFFGIGENGHIAFNDPPVALFDDPQDVKVVELDGICRQQQVNDGCFKSLAEVPTHAITLTVPTLFKVPVIICTVPTSNKAKAVREMAYGPIASSCPASILRRHPDTTVFLDKASASLL